MSWSDAGLDRQTLTFNGLLAQGIGLLVDDVRVATACSKSSEWRIFCKPGRIRIHGEPSDFVTSGLRLQGHFFPQRLTLRDALGKLVWSPPVLGTLNLRGFHFTPIPPRVSPRALPEHIALWCAAWLTFESSY